MKQQIITSRESFIGNEFMRYHRFLFLLFFTGSLYGLSTSGHHKVYSQSKEEEPSKSEAGTDSATYLETIGMLAGLNLYQTYLNIGLIADGKTEGIYDVKSAKQVLSTIITPLDVLDKQLDKVSKIAAQKEDLEGIEKLRKALIPLRVQGQELQQYWDSGKQEHAKNYEAARQTSWLNVSALLGLNPSSVQKK